MRFVMLARNPQLYSHVRLCEAARARGHTMDVVNTLHVHMNITSNQPVLRYNGRRLPIYDAVIPRIGASITHYGLAVLRQFEMQGVYPLNESVAIGRSRDKLRALQLLAREGIGLVRCGVGDREADLASGGNENYLRLSAGRVGEDVCPARHTGGRGVLRAIQRGERLARQYEHGRLMPQLHDVAVGFHHFIGVARTESDEAGDGP